MRVLRVIARMNIGGPARHVSILSGRLDPSRYHTLLVHGEVGPGEASMAELARKEGCHTRVLPELGPAVRPLSDVRVLLALIGIIRRFRPDIVHTHTAKAGTLGRLAAFLAGAPRPLVLHTYHGHVLRGYFTPPVNLAYRLVEKLLARGTHRLIGVSEATIEELVRLRIAPRSRFMRIPVGLDLPDAIRRDAAQRTRLGVDGDELLLAYAGRLVPIKRLDVLLRALALARERGVRGRLVVAGDGEVRPQLETLAGELGISPFVNFVGYQHDIVPILSASDIAVLTSDNEGTPVFLIEASAAGLPVVATAVGGVSEVVKPAGGILAEPGDPASVAAGIARLASNSALRSDMGSKGRTHVVEHFSAERLIIDIDDLYRNLLRRRNE